MDRRSFLVGASALLLAGCAQARPSDPGSATAAGSATASAVPLQVGSDGTAAMSMVAALLSQALSAKGHAAATATAADDWLAALGDGTLDFLPAFAATTWAAMAGADEPPEPDQLLSSLADLVQPQASVLSAGQVDGTLRWYVTEATAASGITSLEQLAAWSKGRKLAAARMAKDRADGIPGLEAVYRTHFTVTVVDDPLRRAAMLADGRVAVAAFRACDYTGATLVKLDDPDQVATADQLAVLLDAGLADSDPDAVLVVQALTQALTTAQLVTLQSQVAKGGAADQVAHSWLVAKGLAAA